MSMCDASSSFMASCDVRCPSTAESTPLNRMNSSNFVTASARTASPASDASSIASTNESLRAMLPARAKLSGWGAPAAPSADAECAPPAASDACSDAASHRRIAASSAASSSTSAVAPERLSLVSVSRKRQKSMRSDGNTLCSSVRLRSDTTPAAGAGAAPIEPMRPSSSRDAVRRIDIRSTVDAGRPIMPPALLLGDREPAAAALRRVGVLSTDERDFFGTCTLVASIGVKAAEFGRRITSADSVGSRGRNTSSL